MTLQQRLGIEWPLIQAPMAGAQRSALAAAVSSAGALGSLPCAMLDAQALRREVQAIKAQTERPFNLNFFCHQAPAVDERVAAAWHAVLAPFYAEHGIDANAPTSSALRTPFGPQAADLTDEFRPAVVSFHFGLPPPELLSRVRASGATILSSATTVEEARWLEARGVDGVIAQGLEAGGHRGMFLSADTTTQIGTFALLPQIVRAVKVPVIAAGGIADVHGIRAAMALGAAGVQLGTVYLLCPEARISDLHRAALQSQTARHTALTNLFKGRPARSIVNRLMRELGPMAVAGAVPAFPLAAGAIAPLRAASEARGSADFSPLWAGQNASGCRAMPAAELTAELAAAFGA